MKQSNFLPDFVGICLSKSQFCYCTGLSPYKLRCFCKKYSKELKKLGYSKYDKLLMPCVVMFIADTTGLRIDLDLYYQVR